MGAIVRERQWNGKKNRLQPRLKALTSTPDNGAEAAVLGAGFFQIDIAAVGYPVRRYAAQALGTDTLSFSHSMFSGKKGAGTASLL
jgi:hypothetical protein